MYIGNFPGRNVENGLRKSTKRKAFPVKDSGFLAKKGNKTVDTHVARGGGIAATFYKYVLEAHNGKA